MEAFQKVDDLVSKPILGSDGAQAWQNFASSHKKPPTTAGAGKKKGAPQAPLKAQERAMGFTSWQDERQAAEQQAGGILSTGYTHFKKRPANQKEQVENDLNDNDDNEDDREETKTTAQSSAAVLISKSEASTEPESGKRKKRKKVGPTIVHDPSHPLEQVAAALQERQPQTALHAQDFDLPPGWQSAIDPQSQKTYYYHAATGERTWDKPTSTGNHPSGDAVSSLPHGWSEAKDATSGKVYYYHAATQRTQWERPQK